MAFGGANIPRVQKAATPGRGLGRFLYQIFCFSRLLSMLRGTPSQLTLAICHGLG